MQDFEFWYVIALAFAIALVYIATRLNVSIKDSNELKAIAPAFAKALADLASSTETSLDDELVAILDKQLAKWYDTG